MTYPSLDPLDRGAEAGVEARRQLDHSRRRVVEQGPAPGVARPLLHTRLLRSPKSTPIVEPDQFTQCFLTAIGADRPTLLNSV